MKLGLCSPSALTKTEGEYLIGSRTREPPPHLHPCPLIFIIRNTLIHSTGTVEHRAQGCKLKMKLGGLTNQNVIISSIVLVVLPFRRILFFSFYYLGVIFIALNFQGIKSDPESTRTLAVVCGWYYWSTGFIVQMLVMQQHQLNWPVLYNSIH
jgi:hypothetical protein